MRTILHFFILAAFGLLSLPLAGVKASSAPVPTVFTKTYYSVGSQDGWVLASSSSNLQGGALDNGATSFIVGDNNANRQYRSILSFNTDNLPDDAAVSSAKLTLTKQSLVGSGYPPSLLQGLLLDIRDGYFGDNSALEIGDFRAAANKSNAGPLHLTAAGDVYSLTLTDDLFAYVNKTGPTQLRLRFKLGSNNNNAANYLSFYSGDNANTNSQPMLVISYHFPDNYQDTTAPAAINDLSLTGGTEPGSLDLAWSAPGDDGTEGTATDYLIRYSSSPVDTETAWDSATPVITGIPTPQAAGSAEHMTLSGLTTGATYYIVVRAEDEVQNLSDLPDHTVSRIATPDSTPPAAITDLAATSGSANGSVDLSWTAPGDDGTAGTAAGYLVRYSASAISNETDWNAASVVSSGVPTPQVAGTTQHLTINGLTPSATYHFVVRAQDEVPNLSDFSNDVSAVAFLDVTSPASISDLAATSGTYEGSVDLSWTAPGDDGTAGTATDYLVRYAAAAITDQSSWDSAMPVTTGVPSPHVAGSTEHMTVSGLTPGNVYRFAVRAQDETPNTANVSNSPSASAALDSIPPAAITNLAAASGTAEGSVNLTWTAPGDNGTAGMANAYLVRYAATAITSPAAWNSATVVSTGVPAPHVAGTAESMTITGLTNGATYYLAVRAQDEIPNIAALSNSPTTVAAVDTIAPSAITDLAASSGSNGGEINLAWTAPGDNGSTGTATSYLVRWSTSGVIDTLTKWNSATLASGSIPTPQIAGSAEHMTVTGLTAGTTYYFAVRTQDERPNLAGFSNSPSAVAKGGATTAPCTISANTTWGSWNNPYLVTNCDLTINSGVTLTIQPGTVVKFGSGRGIVITTTGTLNAAGTSANPISFTSLKDDTVGGDTNNDGSATNPGKGDWKNIYVNSGGTANFDHTLISYGGWNNSGSIYLYQNSTVTLQNSTLSNSNYGLYSFQPSSGTTNHLTIGNSTLSNNTGSGIYSSGATNRSLILSVTNSIIQNNTGYGIYITNPNTTTLSGNTFAGNTGYGVYLSNANAIDLSNNTFTNNSVAAVSLTFSDGSFTSLAGNSGSGNGNNGIVLSGSLGGDTTLSVNPGLPYVITYLSVNSSATLTVLPGSVIKMLSGSSGYLYIAGSLQSLGTSANPISFTSLKDDTVGGDTNNDGSASNPGKGDWKNIYVNSGGTANFDHTLISYGGWDNNGSIYLYQNSAVTFQNGTLSNSNWGLYDFQPSSGTISHLTIGNSTLSNNSYSGIYSSGATNSSLVLSVTNSIIQNTTGSGVYLSLPTTTTLSGNTFAGNASWGVYLSNANAIDLSNNTFTNNGGYAAYLTFSNGSFTSLAGNSGSGNGNNGIILSGSLSGNSTLPVNPGLPYIMSGLTVNASTTLTIPTGSVIKMDSAYNGFLTVNGTLQSVGTAASPVYFTSLKDDSVGGDTNNDGSATAPARGDWCGIDIGNSGTANFDHTSITYSGYNNCISIALTDNASVNFQNGVVRSNYSGFYAYQTGGVKTSHLAIDNSTISNNLYAGISSQSNLPYGSLILSLSNSKIENNGNGVMVASPSTTSITDSTVANNANYGIMLGNTNITFITNSSIHDNGGYGIYNSDSVHTVQAEHNWWGSGSGPAPYGSGNGINYDTVYNSTCGCFIIDKYHVDVSPWLGSGTTNGQSTAWVAQVAEPVNTATGNYSYEHTDLSFHTRSLPMAFSRSYNSSAPANGPLGYGWTFSYNVYITESSLDNSATITYGDGRTVRFEWNGTSYVPPAGTFSTLVKSAGLFNLAEKDQTSYAFNSSRKLSTITDKNGNVTTVNYPGTLVSSITAPDGRTLTFTYDGSNRIIGVSDPLNRTLGFGYDGNGDVTSFTDVAGKVTHYTYDANHRLLSITDANAHTFVTNAYDAVDGRVSQQWDASNNLTTFVYDIDAHNTFVTDPRGKTTTYGYDANLRLIRVTDHLGNYEAYTWDGANNKLSFRDKRSNTTNYTYDARGNLLTTTDPLTHVATNTYDSYNDLLTHTDERNKTTTYAYDAHHNLETKTDAGTKLTTFTYYSDTNRKGLLATQTDPLLRLTTYDYNAHGDLTSITDALTHTSHRTYDDGGRLLTSSDPLGHTTTYTYDNANRVLTVTDPGTGVTTNTYDDVGNLLTTTDPLGHTTTRTYTVKDQLYTLTDAENYVTTYGYDSVGNRTSVQDGNHHTTTYTFDGANRLTAASNALSKTTTFGLDANGNRTSVTDANGHTTTYTFDVLNRQTVVTDALTHATTTTYDAVGNVLSVQDASSHTTHYTYDELNRLLTVTDANSGVVTYAYDDVGNRLSMEDANHHTTNYTYDSLNRLLSESDPLSHTWTYTYDAAGRRLTKLDAKAVTTTYAYDDADRLLGISAPSISITYGYDLAGNRTSMVDATGTTTYTYDHLNRPTSIVQPAGTIGYGYDATNRTSVTLPGSLTTNYVYDAADRLTTVTDWGSRATGYTYDNAGRLITTTYPNGVVSTNTYDIADRLTGISTVKGATTILSVTYTLDNVGDRLTMVEPTGTTTYTYDVLNRLSTVAYPSGTPANVSYTYDAMGNRLTIVQDGVTTNYAYDAADRLTGTTGGSTDSFTWDNNGQMLTKGSQSFSWDTLGRMTGLTKGGTTASYTYNGVGVRTSKSLNGATTSYLQDLAAGLPVVMAETTGGATSRYVYGADLIAQVSGSTPSYYHADGLGSTRALTDATGARTDQYSYDAFGASRGHTGASTNAFTFAGEQVDPEAGLQFLRARYYDPDLGRFISRDAFPGFITSLPSVNRYVYSQDNPVRDSDLSGYLSIGQIFHSVMNMVLHFVSGLMSTPNQGASPMASANEDAPVSSDDLVVGSVNRVMGAPASDCVQYVMKQRSGTYGQIAGNRFNAVDGSNNVQLGYQVGDRPRPGAVMVEHENAAAGIVSRDDKGVAWGHVSYVTEVRPDGSFTIWEGNFPLGKEESVDFSLVNGEYTNTTNPGGGARIGTRHPVVFVYDRVPGSR